MRVLDEAHIPYSVRTYKVDAEHLDALSVAQMINLEPRQVCKTIVCRNERAKILLFCVPGGMKIDLKGAASISGSKKISLVEQSELKGLTGYIRGGVSPLAMRRLYPLFLESCVRQFTTIAVSGGLRGVQLLLSPRDLLKISGGNYGEFSF